MDDLTPADHIALINAIANREGTARQIALWYGTTVPKLRKFVEDNKGELEQARLKIKSEEGEEREEERQDNLVTPNELDELWITKKAERLGKYQEIANGLYYDLKAGNLAGTEYATALRELRSYMAAVANELGQLLHRGAGDSGTDTLSVDIQGIDMDNLRQDMSDTPIYDLLIKKLLRRKKDKDKTKKDKEK